MPRGPGRGRVWGVMGGGPRRVGLWVRGRCCRVRGVRWGRRVERGGPCRSRLGLWGWRCRGRPPVGVGRSGRVRGCGVGAAGCGVSCGFGAWCWVGRNCRVRGCGGRAAGRRLSGGGRRVGGSGVRALGTVRRPRQQPQPHPQRPPQFLRSYDRVRRARRHLGLRRVRRRVGVRGTDPGAREADLGAREGEDHVRAGAQGGPAAARGGVAQYRDLRETGLPGEGRLSCHPLELGQGEHALLHTAAARRHQRDDGKPVFAGVRVRRLQTVTGAFAERAAEEAELEGDQDGSGALDARGAADDRLLLAGAFGGTGARGVVALPGEGAVGLRLPCGVRDFGEVVGHQGHDLAR